MTTNKCLLLDFCTSFLKTPNRLTELNRTAPVQTLDAFQATLRHRPDMVRTLQYTPVVISNKLSKLGLLGFHLRIEWENIDLRVSKEAIYLFHLISTFSLVFDLTSGLILESFFPDVWATHACDATSLSAIGPSSTIRSERKGHEVLDEGHDASGNSRSRLFLASHLLTECQASWELN